MVKIHCTNVIFSVILSDELRCNFSKLMIKKLHPNSSLKILKGVVFWWFWKKSSHQIYLKIDELELYKIFSELLFIYHQKTTPFWILSDELGCIFFHEYWKTTPQFVTQNRAKNHTLTLSVLKNYTSICQLKSS